MTPIETIALIFIIAGLLKLFFLIVSPKSWMGVKKIAWKTPFLSVVYLIIAAIVFYYLLRDFTIVEILAVSAFIALLMGVQFSRYSKETIEFAQKISKNRRDFWQKNWLYAVIWLILLLWGFFEIIA